MANAIIFQNSVIRFITQDGKGNDAPFLDFNIDPVDPDTVTIGFVDAAGTVTTSTYKWGTGDITGKIIRYGVGLYYADYDTSSFSPGKWTFAIEGAPDPMIAHDTTATQVREEAVVNVKAKTF